MHLILTDKNSNSTIQETWNDIDGKNSICFSFFSSFFVSMRYMKDIDGYLQQKWKQTQTQTPKWMKNKAKTGRPCEKRYMSAEFFYRKIEENLVKGCFWVKIVRKIAESSRQDLIHFHDRLIHQYNYMNELAHNIIHLMSFFQRLYY